MAGTTPVRYSVVQKTLVSWVTNAVWCCVISIIIITVNISRLAQWLSTRYRCGKSGVQFPGLSNQNQRLVTVAVFLGSCVASALSHGDGLHHSLHSSAYYHDYNKDLIFDLIITLTVNPCFYGF